MDNRRGRNNNFFDDAPMRTKAPERSATPNQRRPKNAGYRLAHSTKKVLVVMLVALIMCGATLVIAFALPGELSNSDSPALAADALGKIYQNGTKISGVDVSGKTVEQAKSELEKVAQNALSKVAYTVALPANLKQMADTAYEAYQLNENNGIALSAYEPALMSVTFDGELSGVSIDLEATLADALKSTGDHKFRYKMDDSVLTANVEAECAKLDILPISANVKVDIHNSEDTWNSEKKLGDFSSGEESERLKTSGDITYTDEVPGKVVGRIKLTADIKASFDANSMVAEITPILVDKTPAITKSDLIKNQELIGEHTTSYTGYTGGSRPRSFNVWKLTSIVNGVVLQPGQQWSINDAAGKRTNNKEWAAAPGITNGVYTDQEGGGVCQVSTTLYCAVFKANLQVDKRSHHSWPSSYVKPGMDATISTGSPDFVFTNQYDYPITIICNTDAYTKKAELNIQIYGPPTEYKYDFIRVEEENSPPPETKYTLDKNLPSFTTSVVRVSHNRIVVKIYKGFFDKISGQEVNRKLMYTDTYKAFPYWIAYGDGWDPSAPPIPTGPTPEPVGPTATAVPTATATPSATPTATTTPTATPPVG